jgi:hypothetical protein
MSAHGAIAVHDDPDCDSTAAPRGAEARIAVDDSYEITEAKRFESISAPRWRVEQLDVKISAPD